MDWARDDHAVCGRRRPRPRDRPTITVEHTAAGLRELVAPAGPAPASSEVAIERPDGPVVDTLLGAGLTVVVISPNQVKNLRGRYGSAGNKDDRFDAFVLADTLRTDRARLARWTRDSRRHDRACAGPAGPARTWSATGSRWPTSCAPICSNVFPGAVGLFADLDCPISLAFLARFDTQEQADWLTPKRLGDLAGQRWATPAGSDPAVLQHRLAWRPARRHRRRRHHPGPHHPRAAGAY